MTHPLAHLIDFNHCPITDPDFIAATKAALDRDGAVCLDGFSDRGRSPEHDRSRQGRTTSRPFLQKARIMFI